MAQIREIVPLLSFLDHLLSTGFARLEHRAMLVGAVSPEDLLARFAGYRPPKVPKWITPAET